MSKHCPTCKTTKEDIQFNSCKKESDGLRWQCRLCAKEYYLKNKARILDKQKKYHEENKISRNKKCREYRATNKEQCRIRDSMYAQTEKGKQTRREAIRRYKSTDGGRAIGNADNAKRRSLIKELSELDWFVLLEAQRLSKLREQLLGTKWHVDHIIPVSLGGTNEYTNIQVVPAAWNLKKGNRNSDRFFDAVPRQQGA